MPTEPPPSAWLFPPADSADEHGIVGIGADLDPGTLLCAYRSGLFPMPVEQDGAVAWWSPDPRGVLRPDDLVVSRSLRRSCRRYEVRVDTAFAEVLGACADPDRPSRWIDNQMSAAYTELHDLGWAHSIEAWDDEGLAGGLYGVALGGLFAGESMFHRRTDASKVALIGLVDLLGTGNDRLVDVQWATPHLVGLGAIEVSRCDYLDRLAELAGAAGPDWTKSSPYTAG
ncbi:MAG: leucyl/phenylalanyl-tRNA--protein transferase [Acidimicrobiales bacterium]|jgi:leucyl/phenylalanyl-tRNA--protein transferase|nr:leucyl/phenylalanyl-tRNA--protein transferase [Acidimicrobiaceae bacterium]MDP6492266.1 leucyl/phenylalanyl-tRNA--protein transferase [Acidimicrobiales bacterium]MDP6649287.1 leucyl/phenylalanyl-tRNA--protein transferase [Acidimicrobiales bacterium]MDP6759371.1 leucyl/phenylalanyl-tRNA--protein transferase [Acidimicrobiales bacterium]|tara:strand:+ start:2248 stop:2931 length:684 start_codon:yes stop_codon:yes gene_type:complete